MQNNKSQTAIIGNEEITKCLDKLKDSPIVGSEHYHVNLSSLCDVIETISDDSGWIMEMIDKSIKENNIHTRLHLIEDISKRFWLISIVAREIKGKLSSNEYADLDDLFFHYKELQTKQCYYEK